MTQTNNLKANLVVQSQAQKEITINEAIAALDALQNRGVIDKDLATPPGSPAEGDAYIVAASPTGAWAGKAGKLAYYNTMWRFITPNEGLVMWVNDEDKIYAYNGSAWVVAGGGSVTSAATFGVNATADSTNKLSVASDAVLMSYDAAGDMRVKVNKSLAAKTASLLYQNNFSGRAEIGLVGDDHFQFKVSADGSTFNTSMKMNNATAAVNFPAGLSFDNFTNVLSNFESGTWTPTLYGSTTAGSPSYSVNSGSYVRIGDWVFCNSRLFIGGGLGGATGEIRIGGLPYTVRNNSASRGSILVGHTAGLSLSSGASVGGYAVSNASYIRLSEFTTASSANALTDAKFTSGTIELLTSVFYRKD